METNCPFSLINAAELCFDFGSQITVNIATTSFHIDLYNVYLLTLNTLNIVSTLNIFTDNQTNA